MEIETWYYYVLENCFRDQEGNIVYDFCRVIRPMRLEYLKQVRGVEYIYNKKKDVVYELMFPLNESDDEGCVDNVEW